MSAPESDTSIRLRRAKESLDFCRQAENDAKKALADAIENTRKAKDRHEQLFLENERIEGEYRRANGLNSSAY